MGLANQTMMLFKLFTEQVPEGFTIPELVDRLAVARDGRSFDFKLFDRARDILLKRTSTPQEKIDRFYSFGEAAETERLSIEQEEEELGEVPEELLDPLMYTLMEDPV
ncbi:hypothetical protein OXX69_013207, partial [Metschnikowia pulcherrima]